MKKLLLVATGLAVLSTGAYASKARVDALQNSFLISDTRDILSNPADLNNMKNFAITEWGDNTSAEGGFFKDAGKFAYGFYFGNEGDYSFNTQRANGTFLQKDNTLSLFFAGDMGIQWGAKLDYATSKDEITSDVSREHNSLGFTLGANYKDLALSADVDLKNESKTGTSTSASKFASKLGYIFDATYSLMGFDLNANFKRHGYEEQLATKTEYTETEWGAGIGKVHEVAKTARLFTDATWTSKKEETKSSTKTEDTTTTVKATVGYEADATSWLVLRGAVSQALMGYKKNVNKKKQTTANTTDVSAGATFNFGQLKVDGMIGSDSSGSNSNTEGGNLRTDNLMTKVAVHYWF